MAGGKAPRERLQVWVVWVLILARSHMVETLRRLGRTVWSSTRWRTRLGLSLMTSSIYLDNLFRLSLVFFTFSLCNACLLLFDTFLYSLVRLPSTSLFRC